MLDAGHADIVEDDVHVAVRRVDIAEDGHRADDVHAGRVGGHQDLRLAQVRRGLGLVWTMAIMILQRGSPAPEM